jgi:hypothetical protein
MNVIIMKSRRYLVFLAVLVSTGTVSAQEEVVGGLFARPYAHSGFGTGAEATGVAAGDGEALFFRWGTGLYDVIREEDIRFRDNGYAYFEAFGEEQIIIYGGNHIIVHNLDDPAYSMYRPDLDLRDRIAPERKNRLGALKFFGSGALTTAPNYFTETIGGPTVEYTADRLHVLFFGSEEKGFLYDHESLPWVEGEPGDGTGVTLSVDFTAGRTASGKITPGRSDALVILNGFVDPGRRRLYKMNNRVKRLAVRSIDPADPAAAFEIEVVLPDRVVFHEIALPVPVSGVELTILEVYPGSRYNDTCISAVLTRGRNEIEHYTKSAVRRKYGRFEE